MGSCAFAGHRKMENHHLIQCHLCTLGCGHTLLREPTAGTWRNLLFPSCTAPCIAPMWLEMLRIASSKQVTGKCKLHLIQQLNVAGANCLSILSRCCHARVHLHVNTQFHDGRRTTRCLMVSQDQANPDIIQESSEIGLMTSFSSP